MTGNYSNLVYLHDLLQSVLERDVTFTVTLLQVYISDDTVRRIVDLKASKEYPLPNKRRIDVLYTADLADGRRLCVGFEVKTGNNVSEQQLKDELEGLRSLNGCDKTFLVLVANEDPKYNTPYYYIPLSAFKSKLVEVIKVIEHLIGNE